MLIMESRAQCENLPGAAIVPTMGALHAGHASLIRRAAQQHATVVVSIYVNPTQFGETEDFSTYPRTLEADVRLANEAGATAVLVPSADMIYPEGFEVAKRQANAWPLPPCATRPRLEDAARPGHFGGVCQVVARLFDLCKPCAAYFGEKDFQQLRVITQMVEADHNRWGELRIVSCATMRDADGLAISSRNCSLSADRRGTALGVFRALQSAANESNPAMAERRMRETLTSHGFEIDYAVVRDAQTLLPVRDLREPCRALIAARLPEVRLIDNMALQSG